MEQLQRFSRRGHSNFLFLNILADRRAGPIIFDLQNKMIINLAGMNINPPFPDAADVAMPNGIFDERLQEKRRHQSLLSLNTHRDVQPLTESSSHEGQISFQKIGLDAEVYFVGLRCAVRGSQELRELIEHLIRCGRITVHCR